MGREAAKGERMTDTTAGIQLRGALALLGEAERRVGGALEMMAASLVIGAPPDERSGQLGAALLGRDEADRITADWIGAPDEGAMDEALSLSVRSHVSVVHSLRQRIASCVDLFASTLLQDAPPEQYEALLRPLIGDRAAGVAYTVRAWREDERNWR